MDIAALLNPMSVAPTAETGTSSAASLVGGDAFAGLLAEAIGNGPATAAVFPGAVATDGPSIDNLPMTPAESKGFIALPTSPVDATPILHSDISTIVPVPELKIEEGSGPVRDSLVEISPVVSLVPPVVPKAIAVPATGTPVPSEPVAEIDLPKETTPSEVTITPDDKKPARSPKSPPAAKKVSGPPDPPPAPAATDQGAPTQSPNARVEKPDPKSENQTTAGEDVPFDLNDATPVVPPVQIPLISIPAVAVAPQPSVAPTTPAMPVAVDAMTVVAKATAVPTPPVQTDASRSRGGQVTAQQPLRTQAAAVLPEAAPIEAVNVDPKSPSSEVVPLAANEPPLVLTQSPVVEAPSPNAKDVVPTDAAPVLLSAPDLGVVPQVVVTAAPTVTSPTAPAAPEVAVPAVVDPAVSAQVASVAAIPNAEVAKIAQPTPIKIADRPAVKLNEAASTPATATTTAVAGLPDSSAMAGGDDAPAEGEANPDTPQFSTPVNGPVPTARTAATEKPEGGKDRPAVDRHLVVRQVADRIENLVAARPKDGVVVHLEPRDLGTITLVVKGLQNALDVQVTASDDRVRQSLDASRPELAQALAPRGIDLRELRVSTTPSNSSASTGSNPNGGNPDRGNPQSEGRARSQNTSTFVKASRSESAAPRASRSRSNGRGVDLIA